MMKQGSLLNLMEHAPEILRQHEYRMNTTYKYPNNKTDGRIFISA